MTDHTQIHRADAQFKKMQRAEDGRKAMAEYEAERISVAAKTDRLRALRLARDAQLEAAAQAAPPKPAPATKKKTATATKKKTAKKNAKIAATFS